MKINESSYCIILAGGRGRRLWPCSRDEKPKQFIDFFGTGRTQLQQTFDRFAKILPKQNVFICTNKEYAPIVREQLPDLHEENLMIEPVNRGTAPSVAWANMRVCRRNPDASVIITPSDQLVLNEDLFYQNLEEAFYFVSHHDNILTLGVQPTAQSLVMVISRRATSSYLKWLRFLRFLPCSRLSRNLNVTSRKCL